MTQWDEQNAALVNAGVNPVDAQAIVDSLRSQAPNNIDLEIWVPPARLVDAVNQESILDSQTYWLSDESVPEQWRFILTATQVADEEEAKGNRGVAALGIALYFYLASQGQFYTQRPLRPVAQNRIRDLLDSHVNAEERAIADLITDLHDGIIAPAVFQQHMQTQLRRLHINYRALGAGGYTNLSTADLRDIRATLNDEYSRLHNFVQQVISGRSTLPQSQVRGQMYIGTARIEFWQSREAHLVVPRGMVAIERRMLTPADHCRSCMMYANEGWTMLGGTPPPGIGSECRSNCKCYKLYRVVSINDLANWLGTRRR